MALTFPAHFFTQTQYKKQLENENTTACIRHLCQKQLP
jgi:hypothetical protein